MAIRIPPLAPPPVQTPFADTSASGVSRPWIRFLQEAQVRINTISPLPGPFADDAAAAIAGIQVGQMYYQTSGTVVVRLT